MTSPRSTSACATSHPEFVSQIAHAEDDRGADSGDLVGGKRALWRPDGQPEADTLGAFGQRRTRILADELNALQQRAGETGDDRFQRPREFARLGDHRKVESTRRVAADGRVLRPAGI